MVDSIDKKYQNIPNILKNMTIWLCYNDADKENPKAPRDLKGKLHSINSRLYTFNQCIESIKSGFNNGLGIVCKNNGIVCIDYDKCIKDYEINNDLGYTKPIFTDDATEQRILRDINLIDSYTETSPSKKGIHIYLIANTSIDINTNNSNIEIYTNKFIRVSGNLFNEFMYNEMQEDKTKEIEQLINLYGLDVSVKHNIIKKRKDTIYTDILSKFKYKNGYTNKQILDTMFNSKIGAFLENLYNNTLSDADYREYKINKMDKWLKKGIITRDRYKTLYSRLDLSNSGKAYTLIMYLLDFSYGDTKAVKELFINSKLCKDDYLDKKYDNHTMDKIDSQFIPKAILDYNNFRE